jgi:hypothetical protein
MKKEMFSGSPFPVANASGGDIIRAASKEVSPYGKCTSSGTF